MYKLFNGEQVTEQEYKEILLTEQKIEYYKKHCMPRFTNDISNILNYRVTGFKKEKKIHKGQYKLYLSELDFLTDYVFYNALILYVGAAAGHHINELYDKFERFNLTYHLYDTNYFDPSLYTKPNIKIYNEYFTKDHYVKYKNMDNILFISDIRNLEVLKSDIDVTPEDMNFQLECVMNINPVACMLKFRLPYDNDTIVDYLVGEIRLQAFAPLSSTECRLVSKRPYSMTQYIPRDHENRMFYLNKIIRHWYNYDNYLEEYIIKKYKKILYNT